MDKNNINKSNKSEKIIFESEEKFKSLFNGINLPVFVHHLNPEGFNRFTEVNDEACKRYGYTREEFLNLSPADISAPDDIKEKGSPAIRKKLEEKGRAVFEAIHITKNGEKFPVEISSNVYSWLKQKVILSIAIDITDRKLAENALRESEEKYRHLIENSGDAIYLLYNRHFEIVNKKFTELFGITKEQANADNFDFMELVHPDSKSIIEDRIKKQALGESPEPKYEFNAIGAKGEALLVEATVTYIKYKDGIAVQGIIRDISEKRRLEQQLMQAQRMESIGTLAGGVAHDFNNLLTVINGYAEMLLSSVGHDDPIYKRLKEIKKAGKRAENLTRQLLAFSRKQIYKTEIVEINNVIRDMDKMLHRIIGEDIMIKTFLKKNLPKIKADRSQIEQIFMNLVVNSRDAVNAVSRSGYRKEITFETGCVVLDKDYVSKHHGSEEGKHIFFSVSDNGIGMDKEVQQRIFEPFFTTKESLKGTGLGLSTVYGIVKQNKSSIYVYSEPDKGTSIKIYWPVTEEVKERTDTISKADDLSGDESILLVEDDVAVCNFAWEALTSAGYKVKKTENGKQAFRNISSGNCKFNLIITDLIMPELTGRELIEKVRKICPEVKVIYVSGYTDNYIVHNGMLDKDVNFIQKPFSVRSLLEKVRQVLDLK